MEVNELEDGTPLGFTCKALTHVIKYKIKDVGFMKRTRVISGDQKSYIFILLIRDAYSPLTVHIMGD